MLKRLVTGALFAGLAAGCLGALLQLTFVVPLIVAAEGYETAVVVTQTAGAAADGHDHSAHDHSGTPASGATRLIGNVAMFLVTYTGFALLMVAGFALAARMGHAVSARQGAIWGLAGFLAVQLAPAFGLAPGLPGSAGAALELRQIWWVTCAGATLAGIACIAFGRGALWVAGGVALIALPHLIGAPVAAPASGVPPELAAQFAARVLGAGAVAWVVLGSVAGAVWSRQG
jgi:cobalt transporter subunit CbtA